MTASPPPSAALHAAALAAAERGWHVFPLVPGTKRPAVRAWQQRATTDPDRITRCWATGPYNVAIACGPSGLLVIDLDAAKPGEQAPEPWAAADACNGLDVLALVCAEAGQPVPCDTYTVTTPSGGAHLYFAAPAGSGLRNTAGTALGWKIDTRAHGGYVVAAGSALTSPASGSYAVLRDREPALLPPWMFQHLAGPPLPPQRPMPVPVEDVRVSTYLRAALDHEAARVLAAPQGRRNHALYTAAVALGQLVAGGALTAEQVVGVLEHAAQAAGLTSQEVPRTIASGLRAGARRPREVSVP
jgi:hypothetical protein